MPKLLKLAQTSIGAFALAMSLGCTNAGAAQKVYLKMDTLSPGSSAYVFAVAFSDVIQKHLPYEIQVSSGKTAVRMAIDAAKGQVDLYLASMAVNKFMKNQTAMFKKAPEAPKLFKKLRGIINYPIGAYHMVVYADSGIKSLKDIKGKKVFLGPPKGAARVVTSQIVKGVTGYEPGVDFKEVKLDWNSAEQAFQDHQLDVYMGLTSIPSPQIQQLAVTNKIRLLSIPKKDIDSKGVQQALNVPGRTVAVIPAGTYGKNQVNANEVLTVGSEAGLATNVSVSEDVIYNMTKTLFEHLDEFYGHASWLKRITKKTIFKSMNFPLHIGAYRYYKEAGIEVPPNLIPPEAK